MNRRKLFYLISGVSEVIALLLTALWLFLGNKLSHLWFLFIAILSGVAAVTLFLLAQQKEMSSTLHETKELSEQYKHFTYQIRCVRCNMEFSYKYAQVIRDREWTKGFVHCPYCDAKNAHTGIRFTVDEEVKDD